MLKFTEIKLIGLGLFFILFLYMVYSLNSLKGENQELKDQLSDKEQVITLLKNNKNNLELKIEKQKEATKNQILKINKNYENILDENAALCEKAIKDVKRDHDSIYKNKTDLVNKEINKHIKINIDKFNNREVE